MEAIKGPTPEPAPPDKHWSVSSVLWQPKRSRLLEAALWVRDTSRLVVPLDPWQPPELASVAPDQAARNPADPATVGAHWLAWWRQLVARTVTLDRTTPVDEDVLINTQRALDEQRSQCRAGFVLEGDPELRAAFGELLAEAPAPPEAGAAPIDIKIFNDVVAEAASELPDSHVRVEALVQVIPVRGLWWAMISPGAVLASVAAATNPATVRALLGAALQATVRPVAD